MTGEHVPPQIRALVAARDRGELSLPAYRRLRGRLLDELARLPPKQYDVTEPRARAVDGDARVRAAAPAGAPASRIEALPASGTSGGSTANAAGGGPMRLAIIGGLSAVALAVGVWLALRPSAESPAPEPGASSLAAPADLAGGAPAASPLDDFLLRRDWSDGAVSALNAAWWNLSDGQILDALGSESARTAAVQLAERLRRHAGRGPDALPPLPPESPLLLMARNLNVSVPPAAVAAGDIDFGEPAATVAAAPAPPPTPALGAAVPRPAAQVPAPRPAAVPATAPATAAAKAPPAIVEARPAPRDPAAVPPAAASATAPVASADASGPDPCAGFFANPRRRSCRDAIADGIAGPPLVILVQGRFRMGSTATREEQPLREVAILRPFAMTRTEISVGDWRAFCTRTGRNCPNLRGRDDLPVVDVSWNDARDYARWLSEATGRRYRLPTEAEWEYAARADRVGEPGIDAPALNPNTDARFSADSRAPGPTSVADPTFRPNPFGLVHLLGNVREWVQDGWNADYAGAPAEASAREGGPARVVRGASFRDGAAKVRPGAREPLDPGTRDAQTGFRLVRELPRPGA